MPNALQKINKINLREVVSMFGISSATVKNWIRHNYLTPDTEKKDFDYVQIRELMDKISNGELDRLNRRANKRSSRNLSIPAEYADEKAVDFVKKIVSSYRNTHRKALIFVVLLNLLKKNGLIVFQESIGETLKIAALKRSVSEELIWWQTDLGKNFNLEDYRELLFEEIPNIEDMLGLLYQSVTQEGSKAQTGSYYTPKNIVNDIVAEHITPTSRVLDPCCGTGQFLLSAAHKVTNPDNLWGFDIDEMAVRIARINLLIRFPKNDFVPHIYFLDTLLDAHRKTNTPQFDVVMTNPPWGVHFSETQHKKLQTLYPHIKSKEAFSYFLHKGISLLKENGTLSYMLPEAILNVALHKDVREIILKQTTIKKIKNLNRPFKHVFTKVIRLDLVKTMPAEKDIFLVENVGVHEVLQSRLKKNHVYAFDVFNKAEDLEIFNKMDATEQYTLKNNADWALGVVTGDNEKYILEKKTKKSEPILTGKNIKRFLCDTPNRFIEFFPEKLQQVAPENKYRAKEKLLYKFISKDLVFAYDDNQTLTLNSANIIIPRLKNYPIKTILALFNSSLYQFIYQKKFSSLKVLRGDLEKLPLPVISKKQHVAIEFIVQKLLDRSINSKSRKILYAQLDDIVFSIFKLTKKEQSHIMMAIKVSDKLLDGE